ncbi:hypothetical protein AAFM46_10925 [Arthrobacter sp. TMP15]|uniref:hypothetical protein n=1 Tax=Arthrobacter sp. TMP15 TaxID=3140789 RepID=UPI0031BBBE09
MTNQLFLEVLDGRIPLPAKPKPPTLADVIQGIEAMVHDIFAQIFKALIPLTESLQALGVIEKPLPIEPRARALAAKQRQGKGPPSPVDWRGRERNRIFRSQP